MALLAWKMIHPKMLLSHMGALPYWIDDDDPRSAAVQMDAHYQFGGFARSPMKGFTAMREKCLKHPGDPLLEPLAMAHLRDETICFYRADIVAVWQKDGSFIVARFD